MPLMGAAEGQAYAVPPLGIMVETPAAAMIADELAEKADIQRRGEKPQGTTGVGCRCPRLQCHPELQKS